MKKSESESGDDIIELVIGKNKTPTNTDQQVSELDVNHKMKSWRKTQESKRNVSNLIEPHEKPNQEKK